MSRSLFLMRHAKTESNNSHGDKARELTRLGVSEAQNAGLLLADRGIDLALCSSAVRAKQTLAFLGLKDVRVEYMEALYLCGSDTLRHRISEITDEVQNLLVVAHAPGIPTLCAQLAWQSDHRQADQIQCWFPTSTFTEFTVNGDWSLFADENESVRLSRIYRPTC